MKRFAKCPRCNVELYKSLFLLNHKYFFGTYDYWVYSCVSSGCEWNKIR